MGLGLGLGLGLGFGLGLGLRSGWNQVRTKVVSVESVVHIR